MSSVQPTRGLTSLEGKVALVTGGGGGIGTAVCGILLESGARVLSVDLPGRPAPAGATSIDCDLSDAEAVRELLDGIGRVHDRLDVVVHCVGITRDAVLWKMTDEQWAKVMSVNLDSAFHLLNLATPLLRKAGGSVVLVSSINGERGKFGQANYAASKAGLIALGKSAALELGRFGVRVNSVAPGWVETSMTADLPEEVRKRAISESALGRLAVPEDVARVVLFLCCELSRHVTGQVVRVDGGQLTA